MTRQALVPALGVVLLAVLVYHPASEPSSGRDPRLVRTRDLSIRISHAVSRWSVHAQLDSMATRLGDQPLPGESLLVVFSGFAPTDSLEEADALVRRSWRAVPRFDPDVRVAVGVYNTDGYASLERRFGTYTGALVTREGRLTLCRVLLGAYPVRGKAHLYRSQVEGAMAPCALYAGFGPPGRGVGDWLVRTHHAAARSREWLKRPREFIDGLRGTPWEAAWDHEWDRAFSSRLLTGLLGSSVAFAMTPPYLMGARGLRCVNGDTSACAESVLDSVPIIPGLPPGTTYDWKVASGPDSSVAVLLAPHALAPWFLSDVIREEGRERFAVFWKSDQPFATAFREAFGKDLGEWTRWWAMRQWRNSWSYLESGQRATIGATLHPSWPLLVLGWTAVAVLLAAWTARRRQVT